MLILNQDEPDFEFTTHPKYLQGMLDYQSLTGHLPIEWDDPELIDLDLLEELEVYKHIIARRRAVIKGRGDYV